MHPYEFPVNAQVEFSKTFASVSPLSSRVRIRTVGKRWIIRPRRTDLEAPINTDIFHH